MSTTENPTVDNGVNVEALLGAREAMTGAPEAAQFKWAATCEWVAGTHSRTTVEKFFGVGAEQSHRQPYAVDTDHPEIFASADNGPTPPETMLIGLGRVPDGRYRIGRHPPRHQVALGERHGRGRHGPPGDPRDRRRRAKRLRRYHRPVRDRCRCHQARDRGRRRPVTKAVGGVRHRHQSDQRHGRGRLSVGPESSGAEPPTAEPVRCRPRRSSSSEPARQVWP